MTIVKPAPGLAVLLTAAFTGTAALAEYRCSPPRNYVDERACALARQGPQQLRHFVERTKAIFNLDFDDYVTEADFDRWEAEAKAGSARARADPAAKADRGKASR